MTRGRYVDARLKSFIRTIQHELAQTHGLLLAGSWASDEHHTLMHSGTLMSFSDVDLVSRSCLPLVKEQDARAIVADAASRCGLTFKGISIRHSEEMRRMWRVGVREVQSCTRSQQNAFILFWSLLGAAQALLAIEGRDSWDNQYREYLANKWFLLLWRDIAIVSGYTAISYTEAAQFASRYMAASVAHSSLEIKLGGAPRTKWSDLQAQHRRALGKVLRERFDDSEKCVFDELVSMRWLLKLEPSSATGLLDTAVKYKGEIAERLVACDRLKAKVLLWERPRYSCS